jgi:predicted GH43/DUF377 family glycosyl hydrolase
MKKIKFFVQEMTPRKILKTCTVFGHIYIFLIMISCNEKNKIGNIDSGDINEIDSVGIQIYEMGRSTEELQQWAMGTFTIGDYENQPMIFRPDLNWSGPNAPEGWKPEMLWNPSLIEKDGKLFLFYRAGPKLEGLESRIGVAWSDNGVDWEDYENNPIIYPTEDYEVKGCEDPKVFKYGDTYYMYYNAVWEESFQGKDTSNVMDQDYGGVGVDICLAISKDLLHWEKKGVIVPRNISKNWAKAAVIPRSPNGEAAKINGEFLMFISERPYASKLDSLEQIIGHSKDLIHWEFEKRPFMLPQADIHSIYEVASATTNFPGSDDLVMDVYYRRENGEAACAQLLYNQNNPFESVSFSDYGLCTWGGMILFKEQWIFAQGWVEPEAIYLYTAPISRSWIKVKSLSLDKESVNLEEMVDLVVTVKNIGQTSGVRKIKPLINGSELPQIKVEIASGKSETIRFKIKKDRPGTFVISIDEHSCVLEVLAPPHF